MSKTMRTVRTVTALAATGTFAFALSGCGAITGGGDEGGEAGGEKKTASEEAKPSEESSSEESSASEETTATEESSSAEGSASSSSDSSSSGGDSAAAGVVTSGFSEEDKKAGSQTLSDVMSKTADGDFAGACSHIVDSSSKPVEPIKGDEMLKICGDAMKSSMGSQDEETLKQAKSVFTPENITMNDDGTFSVMGQAVPSMKAVKLESDGKMYIDVAGV